MPMLEAVGTVLGDKVNIEAKAGMLVMTMVDEPMTLEDLLVGSPKNSFRTLEDDHDWMDAKPSGREIQWLDMCLIKAILYYWILTLAQAMK